MFNPRQLLTLTILLKAILNTGGHKRACREFVLGAFQQYPEKSMYVLLLV